jgi:hypothetical protein
MPTLTPPVNQPVFQAQGGFAVTPHDTNALSVDAGNTKAYGRATLYVGVAGNIKVKLSSGETVTLIGVAAGTFLPVLVTQVFATNTTAASIVALV